MVAIFTMSFLELQWFGNTAEIRIKPDSYFPAPGDQRPEEVGPRVYLDSIQNIQAFRRDLQDRVVNGCLRSDESQRITRTIAEGFPLPPGISNLIRFGGGGAGFVDLTPDLRLKVVTPVRRSDNTNDVVGYQIAYYRVTSAPTDARVKISFDSASTSESKEAPADESAFNIMFFSFCLALCKFDFDVPAFILSIAAISSCE